MATTKFYLDTRKGEAPFPMKVRLTHAGQTVFILLNVKLNPEQWVGDKVVKHPMAQMMTNQLVARKSEIDCLLFDWERTGKIRGKSAKDVKKMLEAEISLASDMDIDASSLMRAMYGNARLDTIEKMAVALGVSVKSLFEPMGDEAVEGYIKIKGKIYQFNSRVELENLLNCKQV